MSGRVRISQFFPPLSRNCEDSVVQLHANHNFIIVLIPTVVVSTIQTYLYFMSCTFTGLLNGG